MKVGYARVSSIGQSLEVQLEKLEFCEKVFSEKKSAASGKRPEFEKCVEFVRDGDTLFITRLTVWRGQHWICAKLPNG